MESLTNSEYEILSLLWSQGKGLTKSDIVRLSVNKSWQTSSLYPMLNNMIKKEVLLVEGFTMCGRHYGRVFNVAVSPEEYALMAVDQHVTFSQNKPKCLKNILVGLIDNEDMTPEVLAEIEAILQQRREEL